MRRLHAAGGGQIRVVRSSLAPVSVAFVSVSPPLRLHNMADQFRFDEGSTPQNVHTGHSWPSDDRGIGRAPAAEAFPAAVMNADAMLGRDWPGGHDAADTPAEGLPGLEVADEGARALVQARDELISKARASLRARV